MKRWLQILLPLTLLTTQSLRGEDCDYLAEANREMNELHNAGAGCEDGIYTAISSSMIGWGVGLFAGIALLTGLFNSHSSNTDSNTSNSTN